MPKKRLFSLSSGLWWSVVGGLIAVRVFAETAEVARTTLPRSRVETSISAEPLLPSKGSPALLTDIAADTDTASKTAKLIARLGKFFSEKDNRKPAPKTETTASRLFEPGASDFKKPEQSSEMPMAISVTRAPQPATRLSEDITIVTSEMLEQLPAHDLAEALAYLPGIYVQPGSKFGHGTSVSIRGSLSRQVLIMIDGIPFNQQASGQANPSKIPLTYIKQIEIIKGGASSSWGSSLGGVINVITKDAGETMRPKGRLGASFAEYGTHRYEAELSGSYGPGGYYVSSEFMQSDGIGVNEGVDTLKFFGKSTHAFSDMLRFTSTFGRSGGDIDENNFTSNAYARTPYVSTYGMGRVNFDPFDRAHFEAAVKFNDQEVRTDLMSGTTGNITSRSDTQDTFVGLTLNSALTFRDHDVLSYGFDFNWDLLQNDLTPRESRLFYYAPYVHYTLGLGPLDLNIGGRYDYNAVYGDAFSPSYGVVFHIPGLRQTRLRFQAAKEFNAPPLLWRFNDATSFGIFRILPNPEIGPETAWVYEIGFETEPTDYLSFRATLYRADIWDALHLVREQGEFTQVNADKFRRQGFEIETRFKPIEPLTLFGAAGLNDVEDRATREVVRDTGIARQSFRLGVQYAFPRDWRLGIYGYYNRSDNFSYGSSSANDRKFIFDGRVSKMIKQFSGRDMSLSIFMNVYNLLNMKYWSNIPKETPRRYFEGGFTLEF